MTPAHALCVSLHDVSPATFADCRATLAFLDSLRLGGPVALLVVPDHHGRGRVDRDAVFCEFLRARQNRGDEVVLHGYLHRDPSPSCRDLRNWIERRSSPYREGEFAHLDSRGARGRLLRGLAVLRSAGFQPHGFVAPAWRMSPGTCEALDGMPLQYYATRDAIVEIDRDRSIAAPSLVASTGSRWRRALAPLWNRALLERHVDSPVVRAALHPRDVRYPGIESLWRGLFESLCGRKVMTEGQLVRTS